MSTAAEEVDSLLRAAETHRASGAKPDAQLLVERALAIAEMEWGVESERLVRLLRFLGALYANPGGSNDPRALPLFRRALAISRESYGPQDPRLADTLSELALALWPAGLLEEAREALRESIAIFERAGRGDDAHFCLGTLASVLVELDPVEALPICRRYLALEAANAPNKITHFGALEQLGRCLLLAGQAQEALDTLLEAKAMLERGSRGEEHRWMRELDEQIAKARGLVEAVGDPTSRSTSEPELEPEPEKGGEGST
jgi:tetratricopeptide (TPR) repeat protein